MNFKVDQGIWIAARCNAGPAQVAHTTPIYITIGDGGFYNTKTIQQNLDTCEKYLKESYRLGNLPSLEHLNRDTDLNPVRKLILII